MITCL
jgi:hypothetical protein